MTVEAGAPVWCGAVVGDRTLVAAGRDVPVDHSAAVYRDLAARRAAV